jgi:hypothetical protein
MTDSEHGDTEEELSDLELAAIGARLTELRRLAAGDQILRWSLAVAVVIGLVAHVAGYALRSAIAVEPFALMAELLYALGWALWTGAVVTFFVHVLPEGKRRQLTAALDAYDAVPERRRRKFAQVFERY